MTLPPPHFHDHVKAPDLIRREIKIYRPFLSSSTREKGRGDDKRKMGMGCVWPSWNRKQGACGFFSYRTSSDCKEKRANNAHFPMAHPPDRMDLSF